MKDKPITRSGDGAAIERLSPLVLPPATLLFLVRRLVQGCLEAVAQRAPAAGAVDAGPFEWMNPAVAWLAKTPVDAAVLKRESRHLEEWVGRLADMPERVVRCQDTPIPDWAHWMVGRLNAGRLVVPELATEHIEVAPRPSALEMQIVEEAESRLSEVWPEAAIENHLMIRELLCVHGPGCYSATGAEVLGAVVLGTPSFVSVSALFEALVHEGGHLSLYTRLAFTDFLENPNRLAQHSLRPDVRPMHAVLQAAMAQARMTEGLGRYLDAYPDDEEARVRWITAGVGLEYTLDQIRRFAELTPSGRALCASMERVQFSFTARRTNADLALPRLTPVDSPGFRWRRSTVEVGETQGAISIG